MAGPVLAAVARSIGELGRLPVASALEESRPDRPPQRTMANSTHQAANVLASLRVCAPVPTGPVLLLDDEVRSGWTLTVAADLLREAGAPRVLPLALRRR
jgi:ATP-dependent DNA helicase RecQ